MESRKEKQLARDPAGTEKVKASCPILEAVSCSMSKRLQQPLLFVLRCQDIYGTRLQKTFPTYVYADQSGLFLVGRERGPSQYIREDCNKYFSAIL